MTLRFNSAIADRREEALTISPRQGKTKITGTSLQSESDYFKLDRTKRLTASTEGIQLDWKNFDPQQK